MPNYDCGGRPLHHFSPTEPTSYGERKGLGNCEKSCRSNEECKGFVHDNNVDVCGFWVGNPPPIHPFKNRGGRTCHKKTNGNIALIALKLIYDRQKCSSLSILYTYHAYFRLPLYDIGSKCGSHNRRKYYYCISDWCKNA